MSDLEKVDQAASANTLLDRKPEPGYVKEWTDLVKQEKEEDSLLQESSMVVFRLNNEWMGLSTSVFVEVIPERMIHSIPHRSNQTLLGCVNIRGQLWLCASLFSILEIDADPKNKGNARMLAIQKGEDQWILSVDEIFGVYHLDLKEMKNVPVTVKKSTANYIKGIFLWQGKNIAILDDELLFYSLRRSLS